MKPRTVIVGLEVVTDAPLAELRVPDRWDCGGRPARYELTVVQVVANVVQPTKPEARRAKAKARKRAKRGGRS